jgi:hypothetical protein
MSLEDEIAAEIRAQLAAQTDLKQGLDSMAEDVKEYWRSVSPVDDGEYAASVKVYKKYLMVDGMPGKRIAATDFKAHWIEFGTGEPGPTKAAAPRAKTAAHFGGDESKVDAIIADEDLSALDRKAALSRYSRINVNLDVAE